MKRNHLVNLALLALMLLPAVFTFSSCGSEDDPDEPTPSVTVVLRQQTIAEGAEVDAETTTVLTLTYNTTVKVVSSTGITLNGTPVAAKSNSQTTMAVDIPLSLVAGTNYTVKVAKGAIVSTTDASASAPEFTLNFKTKKATVIPPAEGREPVAATTEPAKKLLAYMWSQYGSKTISSVMAEVNWNHRLADYVKGVTGKYPAMNCYDFIQIYVPQNNWINYNDITPVKEWFDAGGIVQLMWHFNVPLTESTVPGSDGSGVTCTPSETTFKASNALVSGTWENQWFYGQMDKVVDVLLKLQDAGIAAMWRPFHEGAGNACAKQQASWTKAWFWWGYDGADTYKELWVAMFDYFKQKGVNNLIWVWTTQNYNGNSANYNQDTDWYPGNQYVDIIARDLYGYNAAQNKQEFDEIQATYSGKMVILGECGADGTTSFANISDIWGAGAKWGSFMVWYGSNFCSDVWWKNAMSNAYVITRDQLPDLK